MLGLETEEAARRLASGDIGFVLAADPSRLAELSRIDPSAPFFAALLVERSGDADRAEELYTLALKAESWAARRAAATALVTRLLERNADAALRQDRIRKALEITRDLSAELQNDATARMLSAEALAAAGRFSELLKLFGEGAPDKNDRERALHLIATLRENPEEGRLRARSYFLDEDIGSEHRRAYRELKSMDGSFLIGKDELAALGRLSIFDRSYGDALYFFRRILSDGPAYFFARGELLGDLGKAFQYGGAAKEGADLFIKWERELRAGGDSYGSLTLAASNEVRFRLLFYAARMKRHIEDFAEADILFSAALPLAPDSIQRDACIWYLLDNAVSISPASAVPLLRMYAPSWSKPASFTDFMDRLCGRLVAEKDWPALLEAFRTVRSVADPATIARYAYVIGRAVSLGYIGASRPLELLDRSTQVATQPVADSTETARRFFRIAFESDSASFYYRCLAASHLGENVDPIPAEERMNNFDQFAASRRRGARDAPAGGISGGGRTFAIGEAAAEPSLEDEIDFLLDFFAFGCADFALPYAQAASARLDPPAVSALSEAFASAGRWGDSLRFVSQLQNRPGYRLDRRDMQLLYPNPFPEEIGGAARRWGVSEPLFYGLVRTESAFIPEVVSRAGAVGLAQLMPTTAADVASRLRKTTELRFSGTEPDLQDPATNTQLGAWYLADMTRRMGSPLMALLSYNGGPSRVRRWRAAESDLPEDLFLETIPIMETRDYGRKVLAASAVYGYLYYGMTLERAVADIFPK